MSGCERKYGKKYYLCQVVQYQDSEKLVEKKCDPIKLVNFVRIEDLQIIFIHDSRIAQPWEEEFEYTFHDSYPGTRQKG